MDQLCRPIEAEADLPIPFGGPNIPLPYSAARDLLARVGLPPTRQRLALACLLFSGARRHVTASSLTQEAHEAGTSISLATVYNSLNRFTEAGLLHRVSVSRDLTYFDTETGDHHHFFVDEEKRIFDIPPGSLRFDRLPEPPEGHVITRVDVVVRLRRIDLAKSVRPGSAKLKTVRNRVGNGGIST
ncbi:iron response transcriptional regulator IrrA [Rhodopseudomonas pseudopalustris]|uniref:iron response transcriptional regulator IrrA n=1 Tax=Rhodopseudomonas pseudopalustris TaxID=1513892 RepID=UPI000B86F71C|nr:Fur family transcriptional regulator [Rhodopseudomonas pseudopalustris]